VVRFDEGVKKELTTKDSLRLRSGQAPFQEGLGGVASCFGLGAKGTRKRTFRPRKFRHGIALALVGMALPVGAAAQADDGVSLADLARSLRTKKAAAAAAVIDNDNLTQVMDEAASKHKAGSLEFVIKQSGKEFAVVSPDATCSLSFNANAAALLAAPVVPSELPAADLANIDGPATFEDGVLRISIHNGSQWNLREITVGLTIVQPDLEDEANPLKLLPAAQETAIAVEKRADTTLLLHLKGTAAPSATAVFQDKLGDILSPDQEWHWAILQAKGVPTDPVVAKADSTGGE